MVEKFYEQYNNVVSINRRPPMAFVDSADLRLNRRPGPAYSVDHLLMGSRWPRLRALGHAIRSRMVFLDDEAAIRLLGFSAIMATGLLVMSLGIAWLIVHFALT